MNKIFLCILIIAPFVNCKVKAEEPRYPVLFNMVHHNPGEPKFVTPYMDPVNLKQKGYTGQVPKIEIQCAITYDEWQEGIIPEGDERTWIINHAAEIKVLIDSAESVGLEMYPFTDILVVPQTIMDKYGDEMKIDGTLSIQKERTQEILRAQINEIFLQFPQIDGLTIRFGETYLHDTPYHRGTRPVSSSADHTLMINLLRAEVCVKRNKKLFYRTWDFGTFHTRPDFYLAATNPVDTHENLYFSIKHVNYDFNRGYPFNTTIGIGKHQQIVEISMNQAGCYGKNAHPYYLGKGIIENWPEMDEPKGIKDLYDDPKIQGYWLWTWGDGWAGPYFENEFWIDLNEFIFRSFTLDPTQNEEDIFYDYALNHLELSQEDADKLRELCLLSIDAVYYGQESKYFGTPNTWWIRDHYLTAINLSGIVNQNLQDSVIVEKKKYLQSWYKMEQLASEITLTSPDDQAFLEISTTYGRIKYEIVEQIWRIQMILAEYDAGKEMASKYIQKCIRAYEQKWEEWTQLKEENPSCPTLYLDHISVHVGPPFQTSMEKLKTIILPNYECEETYFDSSYVNYLNANIGTVEFQNEGATIKISDSTNIALELNREIVSSSVLEFDLKTSVSSNVITIGMSKSLQPITENLFMVKGSGEYKKFIIPVGDSLSGQYNYIHIGNKTKGAVSYIKDIKIYTDTDGDRICDNLDACDGDNSTDTDNDGIPDACDIDCSTLLFKPGKVLSYDDVQDQGSAYILEDGTTIKVYNNGWKAYTLPYGYISSATTVEFDFKSDKEGEEHSLGFDNDLTLTNGSRFKLYGTQNSGSDAITIYNNYSGDGEYKHYTIPVGKYLTGNFKYIVFVADHDAGSKNGTSYFKNIQISNEPCEQPTSVNKNNSFEQITVFPNPSGNHIKIHNTVNSTRSIVRIFDMNGKLMLHKTIIGSNTRINVTNIPAGIYDVQIISRNIVKHFKHIIFHQ